MGKVICPKCKSKNVSQILYGYPTHEAFQMAERGELILGGCEIVPGQPDYGCLDCKFRWSKRSLWASAIKKIRVKLVDHGFKCLDDVEDVVYEIHANGKVYKYTYRGGSRRYTEREEKNIGEDTLLMFFEQVQAVLQYDIEDIVCCSVCDGTGFIFRVSYIDGRTEVVEGDVGGGTLDRVLLEFLNVLFKDGVSLEVNSMCKYYFDEEKCVLYKSLTPGFLEEYIGECRWNGVVYNDLIGKIKEISEEEADDIIKEIEGDEYDLVDGYVLENFSGEV